MQHGLRYPVGMTSEHILRAGFVSAWLTASCSTIGGCADFGEEIQRGSGTTVLRNDAVNVD
jgi:hypothetical protein